MTDKLNDLLLDAFSRIRGSVHRAVEGLDDAALALQVDDEANSIAWLVWHIARIQDDHVAALHDAEQVWFQGWYERFGVPFPRDDTGYGHTNEEVAAVQVGAGDLLGYYDAVHTATEAFVQTVSIDDLDRIVDEAWDPPVTLSVRLVSVLTDNLQHAGQAAYVRGLAERRG
jgi:uncharacterized protein DUF664